MIDIPLIALTLRWHCLVFYVMQIEFEARSISAVNFSKRGIHFENGSSFCRLKMEMQVVENIY